MMNSHIMQQQEKSIFSIMVIALAWSVPALVLALLSRSLLLLYEVPDNLRFIFTSFLSWRILRAIRKGRLQGFDYGTDKLQTFGGFVCSIAFITTLLFIAAVAIKRLIITKPLDDTFSFVGAIAQLGAGLVTGWFWYKNKALARKQYSSIMEVQWRANRADTLGSLMIFMGLTLSFSMRASPWTVYIDPVFTLVMVSYTIASFIPILVTGVNDMLDKTLQEELQLKIDRTLAAHFHDYEEFSGVRARRAGERIFIEIALSFSPELQVREVSKTVEAMRKSIENDIPKSEVRIVFIPSLSDNTHPQVKNES